MTLLCELVGAGVVGYFLGLREGARLVNSALAKVVGWDRVEEAWQRIEEEL